MHILQLLPSLDVGGVERGVLDIAKGLLARGHRVTVISSGGQLVAPLIQLGAVHHQIPVDRKSLLSMAVCVPAVTEVIRATGVDVVHARSRIPAWIGWWAARRAQRPFVTTAHGFYRPHPLSRVMVMGRLVITPSEALARYLVDQFGVAKNRLRVVPRGVDLDTFGFVPASGPHEGPWRIGLFGRVSHIKGHAVALQALAQLTRQGLNVRLVLTVSPNETRLGRQLEEQSRALGLADAVDWMGVRQDIPALIASTDLIIVPSVYPESFGRGVIEAHAVGRPVVASRMGALEELIEDGRTGLLVRPGDAEQLAGALRRLIEDEALRAQCVAAGRTRLEREWTLERMVDQTLAVYEECVTQPRILIWKLSALGDVVLATPSLRAVRQQFPHAHIALAVGRAAHDVVARSPYLNNVLVYDPRGKDRGLRGQWNFVNRIRAARFDLSIDLQNSRRTHLMAWAAGIPVRIGYARKYGWLLNRGVRLPKVILTPIAHQQYLFRKAGLAVGGDALELWPSAGDEQAADRLLKLPKGRHAAQLVGLHPGGSGRWKTKRWDLERWAALCDALAQRNVRVVITGGRDERELGETIRHRTTSQPLIAIGQTSVLELACLIKRCDVFVTQDSAPLHVATAMGTPVVALFGPTDPARHLPPRFKGQVLKRDVFCSPCYSPQCRTITHACMKRIAPRDALEAVLGILADVELAGKAPDSLPV